ncbi:Aspartate-semialdehyde dehydrogenase 2 [subsurface metagenome]|nr:aspartate-semialdehyde dehydrogenase [Clostridia bacterium]
MALKVTVIGVGLVGETIVHCLKERDFPCEWPPRVAATRERSKVLAGESMLVEETTEDVFRGADLVLFAGKEGAKGASVTWRKTAEKAGAICIDNGRDFRLAEDVPLVVPEVNADAIKEGVRFIASPNCSTIQLVVALAPIHRTTRIKRIIISSYQSTSGWGVKGPEELRRQTPAALESLENITFDPTVFARPVAFNCIPHIEPFMEENYTREELKFVYETRKMLGDQNIQISATSVRVPVFVGHGEAIWIETEKPITPEQAYDILKNSPGIILMDDLVEENPRGDKNERSYPTPLDVCKYRNEVLIGRIRKDLSCPNGLVLWCVADNLRKGAALNVVQIAEELIRRNILKP